MSWLEVLVVIGIIGFVIYQQVAGQPLQGKRVVVLPAVVTVIGFLDLRGHHLGAADIAWLTVGAAGSLLIGLAFGLITRLESRDGVLWGKMPLRGLWLWVALVAWRVLIMVLAARTGAHVAASSYPAAVHPRPEPAGPGRGDRAPRHAGRHRVRPGEGRQHVPGRRLRRARPCCVGAILIP